MIFGSATLSWAVSLPGPVWPTADSEAAALKVEHLDGPGGYLHVVNVKGGRPSQARPGDPGGPSAGAARWICL